MPVGVAKEASRAKDTGASANTVGSGAAEASRVTEADAEVVISDLEFKGQVRELWPLP